MAVTDGAVDKVAVIPGAVAGSPSIRSPPQTPNGCALSPMLEDIGLSKSEGDDSLLNCHVSLNQVALQAMLKPLVAELIGETQQAQRLAFLETRLQKLQVGHEQKAEVKCLQDVFALIHEVKQESAHKADQKVVQDMKATIGRMEDAMAWKADQQALEELTHGLQRTNAAIEQKGDVQYMNRLSAQMQKLSHGHVQHEKQQTQTREALEGFENQSLGKLIQGVKDSQKGTNAALQQLQDIVASKSDQSQVDELNSMLEKANTKIGWKANQQSFVEVNASVHALQRQQLLKADQLHLDEFKVKLDRSFQEIASKADIQMMQKVNAALQVAEQHLSQKADLQAFNDCKSRVQVVEAGLQQRPDREHFSEVQHSMELLKQGLALKADRQNHVELASTLDRLQQEVGTKAESHHMADTNSEVQRLHRGVEQKAHSETIARQLDDLNHRLVEVVEQLRSKADLAALEDIGATVHGLATGLSCVWDGQRPLQRSGALSCSSPGSPNTSTTTLPTTAPASARSVGGARGVQSKVAAAGRPQRP